MAKQNASTRNWSNSFMPTLPYIKLTGQITCQQLNLPTTPTPTPLPTPPPSSPSWATIQPHYPSPFCLPIPPSWSSCIHPVFHASLLPPYHETGAHGPNFTRPPPNLIGLDYAKEWEVDQVLNSHHFHGKLQYLVSWVGYPSVDN